MVSRRPKNLWLLPLLLTTLVAVVALQWSCTYGRLSLTAAYDDVSYLAEGLSHYRTLCEKGFVRFAQGLAAAFPHSPLTVLCGVLGFALFGIHDWSPYAVHAGVLFFTLLVLAWIARGTGRIPRAMLLSMFALLPLSWQTIMEFRPDAAAAFATALGCLVVIHQLPARAISRRGWLIVALAAAALIAKPPFFPATLVLFGLACLLSIAGEWAGRHTPPPPGFWRERTGAMLRLGGLTALVVSPYYLVAGPRAVRYIIQVLFDKTQAAVWSFGTSDFSLKQHFVYYLGGGGSRTVMGTSLLWLAILSLVVCVLIATGGSKRAKARCAATVLIVVASFLVVFANKTKTPFFGMTFFTFLCVGTFSGLSHIATTARHKGQTVAGAIPTLIALLLAIVTFRIPESPVIQATPTIRATDLVIRDMIDHTISLAPRESPAVLVVHMGHLGHRLLELEGHKRGVSIGGRGDFPFETDPAFYAARLDESDMVLTADADADMIHPGFPVTGALAAIRAMIDARPDFVLAFERQTPSGGRMSLFRRRPDFDGFERPVGLGPIEGPFPQWNLPRVRWAMQSGVKFETQPGSPRVVLMKAWARAEHRVVKVLVDAQPRGEWVMNDRTTVQEFALRLQPADRVVELAFDSPSIDGPIGTAALFERIQIVPASVVDQAAGLGSSGQAPKVQGK